MNLTNLFKIAFKALSNNKLRGFLTMLGIIIGVGSVITMLAIGQGSKRSIQAQISEMGSNMIMIHPGGDRRGGVRLDAADMESLKLKDLEAIQTQARYISYISPSVNSSGQAIFGANNTPTTVYGISPEYLDIRRYKVEEGDIFSEQDVKTAAKVCLVGKSVVDELFPDGESPVGKVIRFGKIPLRIVGVLESKGYNSMGMDQDDLILAPYTTVQKRILAITHLQSITCSALSEEYTDQAIEEITQILRTNHKLKATDEDDFTIRSQQELSSMLTSTTDMMTLAARRRHRHHEHHVRFGDRTHPGNRPAHEYRSQRARHSGAVPDRIDPDQRHGRRDRHPRRRGRRRTRQYLRGIPDLYPALERFPFVRRLHPYGHLFRMVSGPESRDAQPHRRTALRITALGDKVPTLFFGKPAESETAVARQKKKHEIPG